MIRVDGGALLGMGHLFKMSLLANAIRKRYAGSRICFCLKKDSHGARWLKARGYQVVRIPESLSRDQEPQWLLQRGGKNVHRIFLVDILDVAAAYVRQLKKFGAPVITFENRGRSAEIADATINAIVEGPAAGIRKYGQGRLYRGGRYRIFHPDYRKYRRSPSRKPANRKAPQILVSLGGGTDRGFSEVLLKNLSARIGSGKVVYIQGPAQRKAGRLKVAGQPNVAILGPQKSLATLLSQSSAAVSAGGGTLYELALMGIPGVGLALKPHQERNIRFFEKAGTVLDAGRLTRRNAERASQMVVALLRNKKQHRAMAKRGQRLVDDQGLKRVLTIVNAILKRSIKKYERLGS